MILDFPSWTKDAKCRGVPTNVFFVNPSAVRQVERIKQKFCRQCPVRQQCLEYGIKTDSDGIFGGMTRDERILATLLNQGKVNFSLSSVAVVVTTSHLVMRTFSGQGNMQHGQEHPNDEHSLLPSHTSYLGMSNQPALSQAVGNGWEFLNAWTHNESHQSPAPEQDVTNQMIPSERYSA